MPLSHKDPNAELPAQPQSNQSWRTELGCRFALSPKHTQVVFRVNCRALKTQSRVLGSFTVSSIHGMRNPKEDCR